MRLMFGVEVIQQISVEKGNGTVGDSGSPRIEGNSKGIATSSMRGRMASSTTTTTPTPTPILLIVIVMAAVVVHRR